MKTHLIRVMAFAMVLTLFAPFGSTISAQRTQRDASEPSSSSALVSGTYRIEVRQFVVDVSPDSIGVDTGTDGALAVAIADVTNLGVATSFDPAIVSFGGAVRSPHQMTEGTNADPAMSLAATQHLAFGADGAIQVNENHTIRTALVFELTDQPTEPMLIVRVGDQVMDITNTVSDSLSTNQLPQVIPTMVLRVADITSVDGEGKVTVAFRDGGNESVVLSGVLTPKAGTASLPGCFYNESVAAVNGMSGGTVWLEEDGDTGAYLAWINNSSMGTFDLLNARLIQEGAAGANSGAKGSPYLSWLTTGEEYIRDQNVGLWALCKTAGGDWITEPTAAPVPTKTPDEIRAEYQWTDARDLDIRPGTFQGQKVAIAGTVFNIEADGDFTVMQIWANGGDIPLIIVYEGDTQGVYEGTWVTAYGVVDGTFEGTNLMGGTISQTIIRADILDW